MVQRKHNIFKKLSFLQSYPRFLFLSKNEDINRFLEISWDKRDNTISFRQNPCSCCFSIVKGHSLRMNLQLYCTCFCLDPWNEIWDHLIKKIQLRFFDSNNFNPNLQKIPAVTGESLTPRVRVDTASDYFSSPSLKFR